MSTIIMSLCWPLQMPPTAKAVLVSLADNANDQGHCWPSIATIAERTCFSERAIQNAIKWLEDARALTADRSNGRHTTYIVHPQSYQTQVIRALKTPAADAPQQQMHPAGDASTPALGAPVPPQEVRQPPQEVPSNRQEPSIEPSKNHKAKSADDFVLPDWMPAEAWAGFVEMRREKKKPLTGRARDIIVRTLHSLHVGGHDVAAILDNSTVNSWTTVYAPKPESDRRQSVRPVVKFDPIAHVNRNRITS